MASSLPRERSDFLFDVRAHHPVERLAKGVTRGTPSPDFLERNGRFPTEASRIEVLVCDGVPPFVQFFEEHPSLLVPDIVRDNDRPELHSQTVEIGADVSRV